MDVRYLKKRYFYERLIAFLIAPLFFLMIIIVVPIAFMFNGRPVFFIQSRFGFKNKRFLIYKFRTMKNVNGKLSVNRFSKIMRKFRIDELPQIINLMKGNLSFIGPRPILDVLHLDSCKAYPNFFKRYRIKPGLMGLAQIKQGHTTTVEESRDKLNYDLEYIENVSMDLDTKIILANVFGMKIFEGK